MPLAILGWDPSIFTHMMNISQRHNKKQKSENYHNEKSLDWSTERCDVRLVLQVQGKTA